MQSNRVSLNVRNQDNEKFSFTGIISFWILTSFYVDSIFYFLIDIVLPYAELGDSYLQVLILKILLLSAFPIGMIGIVIPFLPFQKIDFSRVAVIQSIEHKLIFLCTSPLILLGYFFAIKVSFWIDSVFVTGLGLFISWFIFCLTILIWIIFSLWIWELFWVNNTSNALRKLRRGRRNPKIDHQSIFTKVSLQSIYNYQSKSHNYTNYSLRYISFMFGLPILLMMLGIVLDPNENFVFGFLGSFSIDVFAFFFSFFVFKNYLIQQGHSLDFINQIHNRLFGNKDIDNNSFAIGFILIGLIFLFSFSFHYFIPKGIFILIYFLLVLIFISIVWSNQIKALFYNSNQNNIHKRKFSNPKIILIKSKSNSTDEWKNGEELDNLLQDNNEKK